AVPPCPSSIKTRYLPAEPNGSSLRTLPVASLLGILPAMVVIDRTAGRVQPLSVARQLVQRPRAPKKKARLDLFVVGLRTCTAPRVEVRCAQRHSHSAK